MLLFLYGLYRQLVRVLRFYDILNLQSPLNHDGLLFNILNFVQSLSRVSPSLWHQEHLLGCQSVLDGKLVICIIKAQKAWYGTVRVKILGFLAVEIVEYRLLIRLESHILSLYLRLPRWCFDLRHEHARLNLSITFCVSLK